MLLLGLASVTATGQCRFEGPARVEAVAIGNLISWSSASETPVIRYLIQVSADGRRFRTLGAQPGTGAGAYQFLDLGPMGDAPVYRVMAVAPDGSVVFCDTEGQQTARLESRQRNYHTEAGGIRH